METTLIGAGIGALLTIAIQTLLSMRNMDISALNDHIAHINTVEALANTYWLDDGKTNPAQEQANAARLRGTLAAHASFETTAKRLFKARFSQYLELDGEMYDQATGGSFETAGRLADPERAIAVMQACHQLREALRNQRRNIFWAH